MIVKRSFTVLMAFYGFIMIVLNFKKLLKKVMNGNQIKKINISVDAKIFPKKLGEYLLRRIYKNPL